MEERSLHELTDDELIARVRRLDAIRHPGLDEALEELFRRMRAEAPEEQAGYVEAVIARLRWTFDQDADDDPGAGGAGVREPRRPRPGGGTGSIRLAS